jgi:hypothetical protein
LLETLRAVYASTTGNDQIGIGQRDAFALVGSFASNGQAGLWQLELCIVLLCRSA